MDGNVQLKLSHSGSLELHPEICGFIPGISSTSRRYGAHPGTGPSADTQVSLVEKIPSSTELAPG